MDFDKLTQLIQERARACEIEKKLHSQDNKITITVFYMAGSFPTVFDEDIERELREIAKSLYSNKINNLTKKIEKFYIEQKVEDK